MKKATKFFVAVMCCLGLFSALFYAHQAALAHFVEPEKGETDPICGMSVSEDPAWAAVIMFSDGKHVKLHGPKSMFTYYFNLGKYSKKYGKKNVATLHVTDYHTLEHIKAEKAHYVIHSNIQGPMGDDLIIFKDMASAESFTKEHGGTILHFNDITPSIVNSLQNIIPDTSPSSQ